MINKSTVLAVVITTATTVSFMAQAGKPGSEPVASEPAYVDFSSQLVEANIGYLGMNAACGADFGPMSRMATSLEVIENNRPISPSTAMAWVRPVWVTKYTNHGGPDDYLIDASGVQVLGGNANQCTGFSWAPGGNALVVSHVGGFRPVDCSGARPVACFVPTQ